MTKREFIQHCLEAIQEYHRKYTPKERFQHMVDAKLINEKGEVLMTKAEKEAGHPIETPLPLTPAPPLAAAILDTPTSETPSASATAYSTRCRA